MSSVAVTEQSSVEEIQNEKIFLTVLIDTLDTESVDFDSQFRQYEEQLNICDRLLAAKGAGGSENPSSRPVTPRNHAPISDVSLPSRERSTRPSLGLPSASGLPSRSHSATNKRPMPSSTSVQSRKSQRTASGTHSATSVSDLSDDEEQFGTQQARLISSIGNRYNAERQRAEKIQRDAEARFKQEHEDRRLAQQLSAQADASHALDYASHSVQNQSFFGSGGELQRRGAQSVPADPLPLQFSPAPSQTYVPQVRAGEHVTPMAEHRSVAGLQMTPAPFRGIQGLPESSSSDDDDVEFVESRPLPHTSLLTSRALPHPLQPPSQPGYPSYSVPGSFPLTAPSSLATNLRDPQQFLPAHQIHGTAGASVFAGSPAHPGSWSNGYADFSNGNPVGVGGSYASSSNDIDPTMFGSDDYSRAELDALRERGMFSLLYDPSRSKEEVMKLLETIRPDEEIPPDQRVGSPRELSCVLMEHQKLGLAWLKMQEEGANKGSVLADDMGLGKTIQALALMLARKSSDVAVKTTLIIAPLALMRQWKKEIETKVIKGHRLTVFILHGPGNKANFAQLSKYDVVLTTYGKLAYEWRSKTKFLASHPVGNRARIPHGKYALLGDECTWYRVILDEAQAIKNRQTLTSNAAVQLKAHYRLCMTGTPMMNNVDEFFSLIRFLKIPPYHIWENFNRDLARPISGKTNITSRDSAIKRLQAVVKAILLRRNKESKIDGKPILTLPPRVTEITHAVFSSDQEEYYKALESKSQLRFNSYLKAGTVSKNYTNALVLLLRLRQCCDHPHLIRDHSEEDVGISKDEQEELAKQFSDATVSMIREAGGAFACPICLDAAENPTIFFPCGHDVCAECFTRLSDPSNAISSGEDRLEIRCPECRTCINTKKIISYNILKRVRLPDLCTEDEEKDEIRDEGKEDSSSSDAESDDESDADSQGDLRDFIVDDDEEIEEEGEDSEEEKYTANEAEEAGAKNGSGDEFKPPRRSLEKKSKTTKKTKGRAKAKSKADKPKLTMAQLKVKAGRNAKMRKKYQRRLRKSFVSSAKLDKTMEILRDIRNEHPEEKTIIFSQFTTFLDLLEITIEDEGWKWTRYDGSMTPTDRNEAVDRFEEDAECNVMLISLKAGNAGLNLNWASQVIILDPFWNPFIEEQAIDRAHRIGQQREVMVHRIMIEGTVEDRILQLQERKRALVSAALDENAGKNLSRLGVRQLAFLFGLGGNGPPPDDD